MLCSTILKVKVNVIKILKNFYMKLGEEFVILLPETIPYLAEFLEGNSPCLPSTKQQHTYTVCNLMSFILVSLRSNACVVHYYFILLTVSCLYAMTVLLFCPPSDDSEEVEACCRSLITDIEGLTGESIQDYLSTR